MTVLGSTGSIGEQALDIASRRQMTVEALALGKNIKRGEEQIRAFRPQYVAVADESAASELKQNVKDLSVRVFSGRDGVCEMIGHLSSDICLNAISGFAGLRPTIAALDRFPRIGLANKETIVAAGSLVMQTAAEKGCEIIPVDSEHSAIFQCLHGESPESVRRILLTCSGGPFFGKTRDGLAGVTPEKALGHPTWNMGAKITIDCATLMNKGLEVIEAMHLFHVPVGKIEVVIHRESIIHSMVEYNDRAIKAQLGASDMRLPIQYAITYPDREESPSAPLDFAALGKLTFYKPDRETFPLLALAERVASLGGLLPCVMNAANEVAVSLFLQQKIGFTEISDLVLRVVNAYPNREAPTLAEIEAADADARQRAAALCPVNC